MSNNSFIDLTGKQFGKLSVLKLDESYAKEHNLKKQNRKYWLCQCSCGNLKTIAGDSLTKENGTHSCGCLSKEKANLKIKDLTNQRFNRLIAIEPTKMRYQGHVIWKCLCDCGNECYVEGSKLLSGNTQSCGCLLKENFNNKKDLTNQTFGRLTALYPTERRFKGHIVWHCVCSCSSQTECDIPSVYLLRGSTRSCGCLGFSYGEEVISNILTINSIKFEKEKSFTDFIYEDTQHHPRYDFYLPDYNRLIEFDGEQHFKYSNLGWNTKDKFEQIQKRDKIKNKYAQTHNIDLVRIPYTELENISLTNLLDNTYLIN